MSQTKDQAKTAGEAAGAGPPAALPAREPSGSAEPPPRSTAARTAGEPPAPQPPDRILGLRVDATSYAAATAQVMAWASRAESRCVCAANVHMVMEAYDAPEYRAVVNGADLVTPDGMPLVWTLLGLGRRGQSRVYGPTLLLEVCQAAAAGIPVGFYGSTPETLARLEANLRARFPALRIVYAAAPPFRALTAAEDEAEVAAMIAAGVRILFVGLGCPKQERWLLAHRERVPAVMLGVGAGFDFHAGTVRQAPGWLQRLGLEWLFRLLMEPRRLWKRYCKHNPRFAVLALRQVWQASRRRGTGKG